MLDKAQTLLYGPDGVKLIVPASDTETLIWREEHYRENLCSEGSTDGTIEQTNFNETQACSYSRRRRPRHSKKDIS